MKTINVRYLLVTATVIFLAVTFSGCYTQLSKPGSGYSYYDDDRETVYEREEDYVANDADTIIIHKRNRYDVYVHDWYPPIIISAWWYEPYWYYRSSYWWRWHHYWDPWWWGYSFYWGDPYFWPPISYYGGYVCCYWYDPYYYDYGYYYGPGLLRVQKRRSFAYGQAPAIDKLGLRPRTAMTSPIVATNTIGRSWSPRGGTKEGGAAAVDEYYNRDNRRSILSPESRGKSPRTSSPPSSTTMTKRNERQIDSPNNEVVKRSTTKTATPEGRTVTKQPRPSSERVSRPEINKVPAPPSNSEPGEQSVRKSGSRPSSPRTNDSSSGTVQKRRSESNQPQSYSTPRRTGDGSHIIHRSSSSGSSSSISRSSPSSGSHSAGHSGFSSSSRTSSSSRSSSSSSSASARRR